MSTGNVSQFTCLRCGQQKPHTREFFDRSHVGLRKNCRECYGRRPSLAERFWSKVDKNGPALVPALGECWVWTGYRMPNGYGKVGIRRTVYLAHRVAWFVTHGRWPEPCALHECDGGALGCVRPDHLFEGTQADNHADCVRKGRARGGNGRGEQSPSARLTASQVLEIRAARARGERGIDVAARYGIKSVTVSAIIHRRIWKHI